MTATAIESTIGFHTDLPTEIDLMLTVRDPETVLELWRRPEGDTRTGFALSALRLGILALRQASGAIDGVAIRQEGERLVASVRELLAERANTLTENLSASLKQYFDPTSGQLPQRLDRLLKRDGELESLLGRHLGNNGSTLAQTLASYVGENSALLKMLSPDQSQGVIAAISEVISTALEQQREHVLRQFSLDDEDSALSRLIHKLLDANGNFRADLAKDLTKICGEFSLDNENGALSRLVRQVDRAQKSIVEQFSADNENSALRKMSKMLEKTNASIESSLTLDDENSPLYRLRRELMQLLQQQTETNQKFQTEAMATLASMKARREEADRSTRHGGDFQDAVGSVLQSEAQRLGDVFECVGDTSGTISRCKVGDHLITLGPESAAPEARLVCEAKADKSCTLKAALAEIQTARQNRDAQIGIFVFSASTAPDGLEPLKRFGTDLVAVWDQDDPATDIYLKGALSIARALAVRRERASVQAEADFSEIEDAVTKIAKDAAMLHEVVTFANTVQNSGKKIAERTEKVRDDLEKQIELLQEHVGRLRAGLAAPASVEQ